jgi:hypothetical protein
MPTSPEYSNEPIVVQDPHLVALLSCQPFNFKSNFALMCRSKSTAFLDDYWQQVLNVRLLFLRKQPLGGSIARVRSSGTSLTTRLRISEVISPRGNGHRSSTSTGTCSDLSRYPNYHCITQIALGKEMPEAETHAGHMFQFVRTFNPAAIRKSPGKRRTSLALIIVSCTGMTSTLSSWRGECAISLQA